MNNQNDPTNPDTAWEEAMSRDFDARVRDLHEAPLDISSVKGKAGKIKRNRRAAVAGGVLGVAAIIAPVAVLANGGDDRSREPDFAPQTEETVADPAAALPEYLVDGKWFQADGDVVRLPENPFPYSSAVLWGDQLVATYFDGEVFSLADVIDEEGSVVKSFPVADSVVVNDAGTTIAWVDPDGSVKTAWDGGDGATVGSVDMSAPGETAAWSAVAVIGGPECTVEGDGCLVYLHNALGEAPTAVSSHMNDNPVPEALDYRDVADDRTASIITKLNEDSSVCSGIADPQGGIRETCDFLVEDISPDSDFVAAVGSYQSGLGPSSISILDIATLEETGLYSPEGGHIGSWTWGTDGRLVFDVYDGARWHLMTMAADEEIAEIGEPVKGDEFDSPFTLVTR